MLTNSFPGDVEYLQYVSDMPTKITLLRVQFPPNQHCTDAYVQERANGVVETLDNGVKRASDGHWLAARAAGDALLWFAYPKGTSKKYTCDFHRDDGWDIAQ